MTTCRLCRWRKEPGGRESQGCSLETTGKGKDVASPRSLWREHSPVRLWLSTRDTTWDFRDPELKGNRFALFWTAELGIICYSIHSKGIRGAGGVSGKIQRAHLGSATATKRRLSPRSGRSAWGREGPRQGGPTPGEHRGAWTVETEGVSAARGGRPGGSYFSEAEKKCRRLLCRPSPWASVSAFFLALHGQWRWALSAEPSQQITPIHRGRK